MRQRTIAGLWRLATYDILPSTSDLCVARAREGEADGFAVLALRQTAGRGSRGRTWQSAEGNLNLSVLLRPGGPAAEAGAWSLLAGVALIEALAAVWPGPQQQEAPRDLGLSLKWPNDVLLRGRKIAGILLDSSATPEGTLAWLVIGLGANLAEAPRVFGRGTASLGEAGPAPWPGVAAKAVLERLAAWRRVRQEQGVAAIREAWLRHAHPLGSRMRLTGAAILVGGRFAGLTDQGHLLLETGGELRSFAAGEVSLHAGGPAP
jgi:BirA family biotin operon repressor/biotin-[acetyl-CoA-carboxylase] ligase